MKPYVTKATLQVVLLSVPKGLEQVFVDAEVGVAPKPVSFQVCPAPHSHPGLNLENPKSPRELLVPYTPNPTT